MSSFTDADPLQGDTCARKGNRRVTGAKLFPGFFMRQDNRQSSQARSYRIQSCQARSDDGHAMVELAVTMPVMMMFIIGFMQLCMAFYTYDAISEMAREGTRYAIVRGSTCVTPVNGSCTVNAANVNAFVKSIGFLNGNSSALTVATTYPDGNEAPGSRVKVSISYLFEFTIPFTSIKPITMSTSSTMYIIQ